MTLNYPTNSVVDVMMDFELSMQGATTATVSTFSPASTGIIGVAALNQNGTKTLIPTSVFNVT